MNEKAKLMLNIDSQLKKDIKIFATMNNQTMSKAITDAIKLKLACEKFCCVSVKSFNLNEYLNSDISKNDVDLF